MSKTEQLGSIIQPASDLPDIIQLLHQELSEEGESGGGDVKEEVQPNVMFAQMGSPIGCVLFESFNL